MLNVDASDVRLSSHFWSVSCVEGLSEAECSRESVCVLEQTMCAAVDASLSPVGI